ncbi:MAG: sodium transporter [Desulfobulbaceae bacterium]|nr:MAG: sodium transporter [Desulfobulbaceae bacterium]
MEVTYPSIAIAFLAVFGGLSLLIAGGEMLVTGAIKLAARLGMRPLLIGLTVVAFGTSMPEFFVSMAASGKGHPDIMLGNVTGSNIANIGLVLAISALLRPLAVRYSRLRLELWAVLAASAIFAGITWYGYFSRLTGLFFMALLVWYTVFVYRHPAGKVDIIEEKKPASFLLIALLCGGGLLALSQGSDFFIQGAVDIALFFGVTELIIGLTMAAVGTSLPELASCISAIRRNETDLLVGNIIGSNLFNLLMVLGGTALLYPFAIPVELLWRDIPVMIGFSVALLLFLISRQQVSRPAGLVLILAYGIYMYGLT